MTPSPGGLDEAGLDKEPISRRYELSSLLPVLFAPSSSASTAWPVCSRFLDAATPAEAGNTGRAHALVASYRALLLLLLLALLALLVLLLLFEALLLYCRARRHGPWAGGRKRDTVAGATARSRHVATTDAVRLIHSPRIRQAGGAARTP